MFQTRCRYTLINVLTFISTKLLHRYLLLNISTRSNFLSELSSFLSKHPNIPPQISSFVHIHQNKLSRIIWQVSIEAKKLLHIASEFKKIVSDVGFEPTPSFEDQNAHSIEVKSSSLESGALDRSAILTLLLDSDIKQLHFEETYWNFYVYSPITD